MIDGDDAAGGLRPPESEGIVRMAAGDPGTMHLGSLRGALRRATAGRLNQFYATTDPIAERVRKLGAPTLRSIGQISRWQRVKDNDADYVTPIDMLAELREGSG